MNYLPDKEREELVDIHRRRPRIKRLEQPLACVLLQQTELVVPSWGEDEILRRRRRRRRRRRGSFIKDLKRQVTSLSRGTIDTLMYTRARGWKGTPRPSSAAPSGRGIPEAAQWYPACRRRSGSGDCRGCRRVGLAPSRTCMRRRRRFSKGMSVRVQGSGFRVQGSGFRVQGSGFRV